MIDGKDYKVKDIKILDLFPINIEGVFMKIVGQKCEMYLSPNKTGEYYTKWLHGVGGLLFHDAKGLLRGKKSGKYIAIETPNEEIIARLIEDDEDDMFIRFKSSIEKIKDKYYIKVQSLTESHNSNKMFKYIEDGDQENLNLHDPAILNPVNIPMEDEEENSAKSISLFED